MSRIFSASFFLCLVAGSTAFAAQFRVTTAADSGPGSFRQAILDANQANGCARLDPCAITFPDRSNDAPPLRIVLESPLAAIRARNITIGPGAEIHGPGDGLHFKGAEGVTISGLAVIG